MTLQEMGYRNVSDLDGGVAQWLKQGLPLWNQYGKIEVTEFLNRDPYRAVANENQGSE